MQDESNRIEYKEILNDKLERSIVSSGSEKPYYEKKYGMTLQGCHIRVGNTSQQMTEKMISKMFQERNKQTIVTGGRHADF